MLQGLGICRGSCSWHGWGHMVGVETCGRVWGHVAGCGGMWQGWWQGVGGMWQGWGYVSGGQAYGIDRDMWQGWGMW